MYLRHGFPGERLHVLPRPLVREALERSPTSHLLVTDAGHFPHAARHGRVRKNGAAQAIVMLCTDGSGWCELEGQRHEVGANQVVVFPPRVAHSYFATAADPWSIWWLHVAGSDVPALLAAIGLTAQQPVATALDPLRLVALVEGVCDELAVDETSASLVAAAGGAWHFLARLAAERTTRAVNHASIARVQAYLRENVERSASVPELAEMAGFSVSHFSARFRSATGYTVSEYVKRLRMARARQLLITTDMSIAEIAGVVGYSDPFYFSRQFSGVNQVSPQRFRARAVEESAPPGR